MLLLMTIVQDQLVLVKTIHIYWILKTLNIIIGHICSHYIIVFCLQCTLIFSLIANQQSTGAIFLCHCTCPYVTLLLGGIHLTMSSEHVHPSHVKEHLTTTFSFLPYFLYELKWRIAGGKCMHVQTFLGTSLTQHANWEGGNFPGQDKISTKDEIKSYLLKVL